MRRYLLTAAGKDKPGLVARVSEILFKTGANLEDSAMTRLQGEFAILLIFSAADPAGKITKALCALEKTLGLSVQLKPLSPAEARAPAPGRNPLLVSVHGADRPGIVYAVTRCLAEQKINATDITTHRTSSPGGAGYILYVEGEAPPALSPEKVQAALTGRLKDFGVTASVKSLNAPLL